MKQKFKKFFTLDHRKSDGFTLIELIVVIAIIAILAGASVPAYNLYVKKARESADNQLLAAVNTAFASACVENKVDSADIKTATVQVKSQVVAGLATVEHNSAEVTMDKLNMATAFMRYMLGNESLEFKNENIKSLKWNDEKDCFEMDMDNVAIPEVVLSNGQEATLTQAALNAIADSFIGELTAEELKTLMSDIQDGAVVTLLGKVEETVNGFGTIAKWTYKGLQAILDTEQLGAWVALQSTGLKNNTEVFGDRYDYINNTLGSLTASKEAKQAAMNEFNNAMLLYTAETLGNGKQNATLIQQSLITNYNNDTDLVSTGGNGAAVVSAAIRESVYQAYLKTDEGAKAYANASGSEAEKKAALTQGENFNNYLKSDQCNNDVAGLIATMETVQANKDLIGTSDLVQQGMSNEDASKIFGSITGY